MKHFPQHHLDEVHSLMLENAGYCLLRNAVPSDLLRAIQQRFDELIREQQPQQIQLAQTRELVRLFELDPVFESLMDLDAVMPIAERFCNGEPALAQGGLGHELPAGSPAHVGWHRDHGPYLRVTVFLNEVTEKTGPFTLLPGSHRAKGGPPNFFNDPEDGSPCHVEGMVKVAGQPGDCLLNNTMIWHTNTPNEDVRSRKVAWILYQHASDTQWQGRNGTTCYTEAFADQLTNERRRRLCRRL